MLKNLLLATCILPSTFGAEGITKSEPDLNVGRFLEVRSINFGTLSSWSENRHIDVETLARLPDSELSKTTTAIGLIGNLSSSSENIVGYRLLKSVEIFHKNEPHHLTFEFTRVNNADESERKIQYSITISTPKGRIKRNSADGTYIDNTGVPMIIAFNEHGELTRFDLGQPTESDVAPNLHIQFTNDSMLMRLDLGQNYKDGLFHRDFSSNDKIAQGKLSAYDGPSVILQEFYKIESTLVFSYDTVTSNSH